MLPSPPGRKGLSCPMEQFFMERKSYVAPMRKGLSSPLEQILKGLIKIIRGKFVQIKHYLYHRKAFKE